MLPASFVRTTAMLVLLMPGNSNLRRCCGLKNTIIILICMKLYQLNQKLTPWTVE
jgi:hypothetical protein